MKTKSNQIDWDEFRWWMDDVMSMAGILLFGLISMALVFIFVASVAMWITSDGVADDMTKVEQHTGQDCIKVERQFICVDKKEKQ